VAIITSFGGPTSLESLTDHLENNKMAPIERIQFADGEFGEWTVSENCAVGDVVFFLCDGAPIEALGNAFDELGSIDDPAIMTFIKREFILHKCYAGTIMAVGKVASDPFKVDPDREFEGAPGRWHANISSFRQLKNPISVNDLGDIFTLNQTGCVTELDDKQSVKLLATVMFGNLR